MKVLAAIHDLMFSSKVNAAAQGKPISWLPRGTAVAEHVLREKPDVLLIDLGNAKLDPLAAIAQVKRELPSCMVIAYVDHMREELIEQARSAGADQVMSKGEFARRLPQMLQGM